MPHPFAIEALDHVAIAVTDVARRRTFELFEDRPIGPLHFLQHRASE
jgi:hypothetical protein